MNWLLTLHVDETVVTETRKTEPMGADSCTEFRIVANSPMTFFKNPAETLRFNETALGVRSIPKCNEME